MRCLLCADPPGVNVVCTSSECPGAGLRCQEWVGTGGIWNVRFYPGCLFFLQGCSIRGRGGISCGLRVRLGGVLSASSTLDTVTDLLWQTRPEQRTALRYPGFVPTRSVHPRCPASKHIGTDTVCSRAAPPPPLAAPPLRWLAPGVPHGRTTHLLRHFQKHVEADERCCWRGHLRWRGKGNVCASLLSTSITFYSKLANGHHPDGDRILSSSGSNFDRTWQPRHRQAFRPPGKISLLSWDRIVGPDKAPP